MNGRHCKQREQLGVKDRKDCSKGRKCESWSMVITVTEWLIRTYEDWIKPDNHHG